MNFVATVNVSLKDSILDPQGRTILRSLGNLGYDAVTGVRTGKQFRVELQGERTAVEEQLEALAREVLSNPVIESVNWELAEVAA